MEREKESKVDIEKYSNKRSVYEVNNAECKSLKNGRYRNLLKTTKTGIPHQKQR
jgi:hypothetical protein